MEESSTEDVPRGEALSQLAAEWTLTAPVLVREGLRARVYRCQDPQRESVILKQIKDSRAQGFNDWASLEFLGGLPPAADLAPRFLAGNEERQAYLIEDLGGSLTLDSLLNGRVSDQVQSALKGLAAAYGRLHRAARGGEAGFLEVRARLPEAAGQGRTVEAARWLSARPRMEAWLAALEVPVPAGWEDGLQKIAAAYREPGPFLTFTHGDPAPTNNHLRDGAVRLLDFEYGAYRHALYDLSAWEILCPLAREAVHAMQYAWRQAAGPGWPEAVDDAQFRDGWAQMCAFRALAMLTWIPPKVLEQNVPWVGDWTAREAVGTALSRLAEACAGVEALTPVREVADRLAGELYERFPELEGALPRWPAFQPQ